MFVYRIFLVLSVFSSVSSRVYAACCDTVNVYCLEEAQVKEICKGIGCFFPPEETDPNKRCSLLLSNQACAVYRFTTKLPVEPDGKITVPREKLIPPLCKNLRAKEAADMAMIIKMCQVLAHEIGHVHDCRSYDETPQQCLEKLGYEAGLNEIKSFEGLCNLQVKDYPEKPTEQNPNPEFKPSNNFINCINFCKLQEDYGLVTQWVTEACKIVTEKKCFANSNCYELLNKCKRFSYSSTCDQFLEKLKKDFRDVYNRYISERLNLDTFCREKMSDPTIGCRRLIWPKAKTNNNNVTDMEPSECLAPTDPVDTQTDPGIVISDDPNLLTIVPSNPEVVQ